MLKPHEDVVRSALKIAAIVDGQGRTRARAEPFVVRTLDPEKDTLADLAILLRRAYASSWDKDTKAGIANQTLSDAIQQSSKVECFVATRHGRLAAALAVGNPEAGSSVGHYRRCAIAVVKAEAVDPIWRGRGIGGTMLGFACRWLGAQGYTQLAIEIPMYSVRLLELHRRRGFKLVDVVVREGESWERAVMSRPIMTGSPPCVKSGACTT